MLGLTTSQTQLSSLPQRRNNIITKIAFGNKEDTVFSFVYTYLHNLNLSTFLHLQKLNEEAWQRQKDCEACA